MRNLKAASLRRVQLDDMISPPRNMRKAPFNWEPL
jgi:hypothetical protein